jgi:hypothetical protein
VLAHAGVLLQPRAQLLLGEEVAGDHGERWDIIPFLRSSSIAMPPIVREIFQLLYR